MVGQRAYKYSYDSLHKIYAVAFYKPKQWRSGKGELPLHLHGPQRAVYGIVHAVVKHPRQSRLKEVEKAEVGKQIFYKLPSGEIIIQTAG